MRRSVFLVVYLIIIVSLVSACRITGGSKHHKKAPSWKESKSVSTSVVMNTNTTIKRYAVDVTVPRHIAHSTSSKYYGYIDIILDKNHSQNSSIKLNVFSPNKSTLLLSRPEITINPNKEKIGLVANFGIAISYSAYVSSCDNKLMNCTKQYIIEFERLPKSIDEQVKFDFSYIVRIEGPRYCAGCPLGKLDREKRPDNLFLNIKVTEI